MIRHCNDDNDKGNLALSQVLNVYAVHGIEI